MKNTIAKLLFRNSLVYNFVQIGATLFVLSGGISCNPAEKPQQRNSPPAHPMQDPATQKMPDTSLKAPVFPGGDAIQQHCEFIQDQAEDLLEKYRQPGVPDKRRREIIENLEKLNQQWKANDCQQVFGFMVPAIPRLPHPDTIH